ncbi:glycosyltransferase [Salinirubellus sp. GCM10025818]|uniref:glycosyltransferase n=1 Tax=Salinirubellus TaxID=2162630 RepID=UPI0030D34535
MAPLVYYLPNVTDVTSVTPYNHAIAVADLATESTLLTYPAAPPAAVEAAFDRVVVLRSGLPPVRAWRASRIADRLLDAEDGVYLTTFHYAPALSGYLSDRRWVLDVYDDPMQYVYNRDSRVQPITVRGLLSLLDRADRAVHTVHPSTPRTFSGDVRFAANGADVEGLEPSFDVGDTLRLVHASSHDAGLAVTLEALAGLEAGARLDVYGDVPERHAARADALGVTNDVTFHGPTDHGRVRRAVERADVGLCLLGDRPDWRYAHPIRIGEFLAAGTVPLASDLPGVRDLTRDAGVLVSPTSIAVESALARLADCADLAAQKRRARERAEYIPWHEERRWFARQVLGLDQYPS